MHSQRISLCAFAKTLCGSVKGLRAFTKNNFLRMHKNDAISRFLILSLPLALSREPLRPSGPFWTRRLLAPFLSAWIGFLAEPCSHCSSGDWDWSSCTCDEMLRLRKFERKFNWRDWDSSWEPAGGERD